MARIELRITDHLLIPFGRPKWNIDQIKITGVSTLATYFQSDTPLVHINRGEKTAVRLRHFCDHFPDDFPVVPEPSEALEFIQEHLKRTCHLGTDSERKFLDLYFDYCNKVTIASDWERNFYKDRLLPAPKDDPLWVFDALVPLPQAHL